MLTFLMILVIGGALVYGVQRLDIECTATPAVAVRTMRPASRRRAAKALDLEYATR